MPPETYEEYRVAWRFPNRSEDSYSTVTRDRAQAERSADRVKSNSRVQKRTVVVGDWEEVDDAS